MPDDASPGERHEDSRSEKLKRTRAHIRVATLNMNGRGGSQIYTSGCKWAEINAAIRNRKISIAAVQETHLDDQYEGRIAELFPRLWVINSQHENATNTAGVAIVINRDHIDSQGPQKTWEIIRGRAIMAQIDWKDNVLGVLAVYGPNDKTESAKMWADIHTWCAENPRLAKTINVVLGDFNFVEDDIDRMPARYAGVDDAREQFSELKKLLGVHDGWRHWNPRTIEWTWRRPRTGGQPCREKSRIDRIYLSREWLDESRDWTTEHALSGTDHYLVSVDLTNKLCPTIGKGRWAMPNSVVDDKKFQDNVRPLVFRLKAELDEIRSSRSRERNPQKVFEEFKRNVRSAAKLRAKAMGSDAKKRIRELDSTRRKIQQNAALDEADRTDRVSALEEEIEELCKRQARQSSKNMQAREQVEGERMSKYFFKKGKQRKPRDAIRSLKMLVDGPPKWATDSARMAEIAREFYEKLQTADTDVPELEREAAIQASLDITKQRLDERQASEMGGKVKRELVEIALTESKNDSAPGLDGLPYEFWKMLARMYEKHKKDDIPWPDIIGILTEVYNDIEEHGVDEDTSFTLGWMCPLWKKGNRDEIANYRPITLLNSDYKVYTKCLAIKLAEVIEELVHDDQAGFIKGRSIFDQCRLARLMIDWGEATQTNGAIVCLDQEKAYDRIRHDYLLRTLEAFGIPQTTRATIQSLYARARTIVIINGVESRSFQVVRGVRQGDPLSCLLFNLAIEPLAELLRSSELAGFRLPVTGKKLITSLFADDTCVYLSENDDAALLFGILDKWCRASGARFNVKKTEVVPLGTQEYREGLIAGRRLNADSEAFPANVRIAGQGEPVRLLGAYIGNGISQEGPWTAILDSIRRSLSIWGKRNLTLSGKSIVIQAVVGGKTQYLSTVQGMPDSVQNEIRKEIQSFIRPPGAKAAIISEQMLYKPKREGGKNILDIKTVVLARESRWIEGFMRTPEARARWTEFAEALLTLHTSAASGGRIPLEARVSPFTQDWSPDLRKVGYDMRRMMQAAKKLGVRIDAPYVNMGVKMQMPIWLHVGRRSKDKKGKTLRASQRDKVARCLHQLHVITTTGQALRAIQRWEEQGHLNRAACNCDECCEWRNTGCAHPYKCRNRLRRLLDELDDKWDPRTVERNQVIDIGWEEKQRLYDAKMPEGLDELKSGLYFNPSLPRQRDVRDLFRALPRTRDRDELEAVQDSRCTGLGKSGPAGREVIIAVAAARRQSSSTGYVTGGAAATFPGTEWSPLLSRLDEEWADSDSAVAIALTLAAREIDQLTPIRVHICDIVVARCLTSELQEMTAGDWDAVGQNHQVYRTLVNELKNRAARTLIVFDDESEMAANAKQEAERALDLRRSTGPPAMQGHQLMLSGVPLGSISQSEVYKRLVARAKAPKRKGLIMNMGRTQATIAEISGSWPSEAEIWESINPSRFGRSIREFIWKTLHNTAKVGAYWLHVEGKEGRSECPQCQVTESMDHILFECEIPGQNEIWEEVSELWTRTGLDWPTPSLGLLLGCGMLKLGHPDKNGKQDEGISRLFCILISEACFLIWKIRNERRIAHKDDENEYPIPPEIVSRWRSCLKGRVGLDVTLAQKRIYKRRSVKPALMRATWEPILGRGPDGKVSKRWWAEPEFLVSMWPPRPRGRER